jgi:hypothetical protein
MDDGRDAVPGATVEDVEHGHRIAELHRRVAGHLRREPGLLLRARDRVAQWLEDGGPVPPFAAKRWQELLDRPLPEILAALVEDSEEMRNLRQSSPFAGVLSQDERVEVIRSVH